MTLAPLSLVNGLVYPLPTICLLGFYLFGRHLHCNGLLVEDGASKIEVGSAIVNTSHLATLGMATFLALRMIRGKLCL